MKWGLLVPILALMIPIMGIVAAMFSKWLALKEKQIAATTSLTAEKTAQYAAHTERLEQRVRVLERIATDRGADLSDEIERLRDARADH